MKYKKLSIFLLTGLALISGGIFHAKTAYAVAPTGASADIQGAGVNSVQIVLTGADFVNFVHSGTPTPDSTDLANVEYNGAQATDGEINASTGITFTFPISMGTGKSGGDFTIQAGTIADAGAIPNALITITDSNIDDFAAPVFVSQKITSSSIVTIIYTEPVNTVAGHYTNFGGDLAGNSIASLTGSGTATIILNLTTPVSSNAVGTMNISGLVADTSPSSNILGIGVGINRAVVDGQAPDGPTASPVAGTYPGTQNVTLSSSGSTSIRYTIDDTDPSTCSSGSLYSAAIRISSSRTINARGCDDAENISSLGTFAYVKSSLGSSGGGFNPNPAEIPGYVPPASPPDSTPPSTTPLPPLITPQAPPGASISYLVLTSRKGDNGESVRRLQHFLRLMELFDYSSDTGFFGPITEAAVKKFQETYRNEILAPLGLMSPTGIVGPMTIKQINKLIDDRKLIGI